MKIPESIKKAAKPYTQDGFDVLYLGREKESIYYYIDFHGATVGFPVVYCLDGSNVTEISDFEAVKLIGRFLEH